MSHAIPKKELGKFVASLKKEYDVIAPVRQEDGRTEFVPLRKEKPDFDYANTFYSPKNFFFPPSEELFEYDGNVKETNGKVGRRILLGVRPCDANALLVLDKVFLEGFVDPYYERKRENTVIAVFDCVKAGENCFCESLGTDKAKKFDLRFVDAGEEYLVEAGSPKGDALLMQNKALFRKTSEKLPVRKIACKKKLDKATIDNLEKYWDSPVWSKTAERCLSCGACTMVCPTCTCFNFEDHLIKKGCARERKWDSCQFKTFTSVSGKFVFRKERFKRLRHFVFHKLEYFRKQYGFRTCVGCGRCEEACLTGINIPEMIGDLKK